MIDDRRESVTRDAGRDTEKEDDARLAYNAIGKEREIGDRKDPQMQTKSERRRGRNRTHV